MKTTNEFSLDDGVRAFSCTYPIQETAVEKRIGSYGNDRNGKQAELFAPNLKDRLAAIGLQLKWIWPGTKQQEMNNTASRPSGQSGTGMQTSLSQNKGAMALGVFISIGELPNEQRSTNAEQRSCPFACGGF